MHISLADMLTFPPLQARAASAPQGASGTAPPRERTLERAVPSAPPPVNPLPKPAAERPAAQSGACVVTIGQMVRPEEGVTYNRAGTLATASSAPSPGLPDLDGMTLEKQLHVGREMGVFTKITLHNDGVLVARPDGMQVPRTPEFVRSAVTTIKDFQEGFATLTQRATQPI